MATGGGVVLEEGGEAGRIWDAARQMTSPIAPAIVLWLDVRADMHVLISKQAVENLRVFTMGILDQVKEM